MTDDKAISYLLGNISVNKDDARWAAGDNRLWNSRIGTTYPQSLKKKLRMKNKIEKERRT